MANYPDDLSVSYQYYGGESQAIKFPHAQSARRLPFIVVVYVLEGMYFVTTATGTYRVMPGEAVVVPEYMRHDVRMDAEGRIDYMHISCHLFGRDMLMELTAPLPVNGAPAEALSAACRALDRLMREAECGPLRALTRDRLIIGAMETLSTLVPLRAVCPSESIARVLAHVQANPARHITEADLSQVAAMSPSGFARAFRMEMHMSPMEYVAREKMKVACELLCKNLSVYETANRVGFEDPLYFSKVFTRRVGLTPTAYKRQYRSQ